MLISNTHLLFSLPVIQTKTIQLLVRISKSQWEVFGGLGSTKLA